MFPKTDKAEERNVACPKRVSTSHEASFFDMSK
jgi:hypothetical protein